MHGRGLGFQNLPESRLLDADHGGAALWLYYSIMQRRTFIASTLGLFAGIPLFKRMATAKPAPPPDKVNIHKGQTVVTYWGGGGGSGGMTGQYTGGGGGHITLVRYE